MNRVSRREFIEMSASGVLALMLGGYLEKLLAGEKKSRVIDVRSEKWFRDRRVQPEVVKRMLNEGLMKLTQKTTPEQAWKSLFSPREVVGVKFNRLSGNYTGANQALVDAIAEGLFSAGLKPENIIVVEAVGARFQGGKPQRGWAGQYDFGSGKTRLSNFLVNQVDGIINVPNLKDHGIAGITGALKNVSHARNTFMEGPNRFHKNHCDPYIADINALKVVREKLRLHISNALKGVFEGGPSARNPALQWFHNGLLLSFDPVALDTISHRFIEEARRTHRRPSLSRVGRPPIHIATASKRALGTNNPLMIDLVKVMI